MQQVNTGKRKEKKHKRNTAGGRRGGMKYTIVDWVCTYHHIKRWNKSQDQRQE
jgi:hypothetical protein